MLYVPRRSPLAFPAGVAPGFDPTHVASQGQTFGSLFSAVATPGGFLSICDGRPGTPSGGPTSTIDGNIGPASVFTNAAKHYTWSGGLSLATPLSYTLGAIFRPTAFAAGQSICSLGQSSGHENSLQLSSTGQFQTGYGATTGSGIFLTAGVPYFGACSIIGTIGTGNFVVVNLQTGQVFLTQVVINNALKPSDGNFGVGSLVGANNSITGNIAAAMGVMSPVQFGPQQLLQWAADPWSFWYPRQTRRVVGRSGTIFRKTRSQIGTRIGERQAA